jgi:serine/threonine protein kinase
LEYLKNKKTCHGDIKAKTILISSNGRAFLADSYFLNGGKVSY